MASMLSSGNPPYCLSSFNVLRRIDSRDSSLRGRPGARFPHHRHLGHEVSLVLDGLLEERGQVHGPGSIVKAERGTAHDYAAGPGRDLLLVSVHGGFEILP